MILQQSPQKHLKDGRGRQRQSYFSDSICLTEIFLVDVSTLAPTIINEVPHILASIFFTNMAEYN